MDERELNRLLADKANESIRQAILDSIPNESQRKLVEEHGHEQGHRTHRRARHRV
jgi:hypothetical protein